jgi:hypothetical protein
VRSEQEVNLELFYVFDFETDEHELFRFTLSVEDFDQLCRGLIADGYATLRRVDGFQFEWRRSPRGFEFKLRGRATDPIVGARSVEFTEYREVPCGDIQP